MQQDVQQYKGLGRGGKEVVETSCSSMNKQADSQMSQIKRWVKATWMEKGQQMCDTIPRSWVSKSLSTVWWPPAKSNYKRAIDTCKMPPEGHANWSKFKLKWCSKSVDSLAEAQCIETENVDTYESSAEDELSTAKDQNSNAVLGRGFRPREKTHKLKDYDSQSPAMDTTDGTVSPIPTDRGVARFLTGEVGDMTASMEALNSAAQSVSSNSVLMLTPSQAQKKQMSSNSVLHTTQVQKKRMSSNDVLLTPTQPQKKQMSRQTMIAQDDTEVSSDTPVAPTQKETPEPPVAAQMAINSADVQQVKTLIVQLSAACKLRHDEMLHKMETMEKKIALMDRKLSAHRSSGQEAEKSSGEEEDDGEPQFCVSIPVHTFEDFNQLEEELETSKAKRRLLKKMMHSLGGRDANDLVARCISSVIQRPQLAQYFNCGGYMKAGSVLEQPIEKHNFMGTHTQKVLLQVLKKAYKSENLRSLRSKASDILKRSSTLRGGEYYKKKKMQATCSNSMAMAGEVPSTGSISEDSETVPPNKKSTSKRATVPEHGNNDSSSEASSSDDDDV